MRQLLLRFLALLGLGGVFFAAPLLWSQTPSEAERPQPPNPVVFPPGFPPGGEFPGADADFFGPGGPGPRQGPGGFPPMRQRRELIPEFDRDGDGYLNADERAAARASQPAAGFGRGPGPGSRGFPGGPGGRGEPRGLRGPGGRGFPGGFGSERPAPQPGPRVSSEDVTPYPEAPLYDPGVLRTFFLEFDNPEWEAELADFKDTDVEVPATLIVDGVPYPQVGVGFRGMSSYMMVPAGYKRSLRLSLDFLDAKQNLLGYRTLNLLNQHGDPSLLSTVLYSHIARQYLPAPRANLVRLVVNGESWGIYTNLQQFNKDYLQENFGTTQGARWKVPGSPMARGGLEYLGEAIEPYRAHYELKSKESENAWRDLIALCQVIHETPMEKLEEQLGRHMNLDRLLWFLALDVALINNDGYWVRSSDYSLFQDAAGTFHVLPYDMNEAFQGLMAGPMGGIGRGGPRGPRPGGRGREPIGPPDSGRGLGGRGPGGFGPGFFGPGAIAESESRATRVALDPLVGVDDPRKPLRSKVLAVPSLRARYLQNLRTIAEKSLDWRELGPVVAQFRELIAEDVARETRLMSSLDEFLDATCAEPSDPMPQAEGDEAAPWRRGRPLSLRSFAEQRQQFLLDHPDLNP